MAYVILNLVCVAALVGIDQAIKLWATQYLAPCLLYTSDAADE